VIAVPAKRVPGGSGDVTMEGNKAAGTWVGMDGEKVLVWLTMLVAMARVTDDLGRSSGLTHESLANGCRRRSRNSKVGP